MGVQLVAVLAAIAIAALGTALIMTLVNAMFGAKAGVKEQLSGLDLSEHGEEAYFGEQGATPAGLSLGAGVIVSGVPANVEAA
jgi:ammonia channel protein AmtB